MIHRLSLVLFSLLLSAGAFAQPFQVLEITPPSGPIAGGTQVIIRMNELPNCPILAPGPVVRFGEVDAPANTNGVDSFIVTSPINPPGQVDLRIIACGMDDLTVTNGFSYFYQGGTVNPFRVLTVTPPSGPITGGTEVTVKVDDIPFCSDPVPGPGLVFDGVEATNVREDHAANTITGVTPPHALGSVGLVVRTCGGPQVFLQSGFTYNNQPDPNPAYEKVLLPVLFFGPGAHGSQWATQISVYNAGRNTVTAANVAFSGSPICPAVCGCGPVAGITPGQTAEVCSLFADPFGMILYMPKAAEKDLNYHARAFDTSRSTANAGTEIPVVREREFRSDFILLQDLPLDEHFRLGLRVFNPDQNDGAQVKMQVLDTRSTSVYGERIITLSYPIRTIVLDPYPNRPAYANLGDLDTIVREILGSSAGSIDRFHLRITPVAPDIRFWAFATITNNETQLITTVSPQF